MKKTHSLYSLALLITFALILTANYQVYAMITPWLNATLVHRVPPSQAIKNNPAEHTIFQPTSPQKIMWQTTFKAAEEGDLEAVKEHFESWQYTFLPWHYYHQAIAKTLEHAAGLPASKTGSVVDYLLTRVQKEKIDHPEAFLDAGIQNKHSAIIQYVDKNFGEQYTASALDQAIEGANLTAVQTLLYAGVNPHAKQVTHDCSPALHRALRVFSAHDDHAKTTQRLAILAQLIDKLKPEQVPAAFQVNMCYGLEDERHTPEPIRHTVASLLNAKHIPTRQCMQGARRVLNTVDHSIGIALTDADFPEEEVKPVIPQSKLHRAAQAGNYKEGLAFFTELSKKIFQDEPFPSKEYRIVNKLEKATEKEQQAAKQFMDQFDIRTHTRMDILHAVAREAQREVDNEGRSAYDIARAHNAPQNLIDLLDPQNPASALAIKEELEKAFMNNVEKTVESLNPQHKTTAIPLSLPVNLRVGDIIVINGVEYTIMEEFKNDQAIPRH